VQECPASRDKASSSVFPASKLAALSSKFKHVNKRSSDGNEQRVACRCQILVFGMCRLQDIELGHGFFTVNNLIMLQA